MTVLGHINIVMKDDSEPWSFEYFSIGVSGKEAVLPQFVCDNPIMSLAEHPKLKSQLNDLIKIRLKADYQAELRHSFLAYAFLMTYISARSEQKNMIPTVVVELLKILDAKYPFIPKNQRLLP